MSTWFVYILHCADGTLYTGVTTDPERRLREHNAGGRLAARYTRARRPVALAHVEPACGSSMAAAVSAGTWPWRDHAGRLAYFHLRQERGQGDSGSVWYSAGTALSAAKPSQLGVCGGMQSGRVYSSAARWRNLERFCPVRQKGASTRNCFPARFGRHRQRT